MDLALAYHHVFQSFKEKQLQKTSQDEYRILTVADGWDSPIRDIPRLNPVIWRDGGYHIAVVYLFPLGIVQIGIERVHARVQRMQKSRSEQTHSRIGPKNVFQIKTNIKFALTKLPQFRHSLGKPLSMGQQSLSENRWFSDGNVVHLNRRNVPGSAGRTGRWFDGRLRH